MFRVYDNENKRFVEYVKAKTTDEKDWQPMNSWGIELERFAPMVEGIWKSEHEPKGFGVKGCSIAFDSGVHIEHGQRWDDEKHGGMCDKDDDSIYTRFKEAVAILAKRYELEGRTSPVIQPMKGEKEINVGRCNEVLIDYNNVRDDITPSDVINQTTRKRLDEGTEDKCIASAAGKNPKEAYGNSSLPLHLWPPLASAYGCLSFLNGGLKYGFKNYLATPVLASIYISAAMRHLDNWLSGEEFDPVDGVPHLGAVLANVAILLEARSAGTLVDDRPMACNYLKDRDELKTHVSRLYEFYKDKKPKHYTLADAKGN